jgi:lactoylglutathione lyase
MKTVLALVSFALVVPFSGCASPSATATSTVAPTGATVAPPNPSTLPLGAFSISLAVKDLAASRAFYEKLGFTAAGGAPAQGWQILRSGDTVIGLFQGMFPKNLLTFNPGWTQQATNLATFTDVRDIQTRLQEKGLTLTTTADPASTGPASLTLVDPDGNPILIDQHVPKAK